MDRLRLGSFSKGDSNMVSRRAHVLSPTVQENVESGPTPRCVIVQRDEKGYGLTVSGDNPVFVQEVKPGGAAYKAGVHEGDRIVKVNGTLVTQANHSEVVKLIRSGQFVALTLIGPNTPRTPSANFPSLTRGPSFIAGSLTPHQTRSQGQTQTRSQERISCPQLPDPEQQAQCTHTTVSTINKMLTFQRQQLDQLKENLSSPSDEAAKANLKAQYDNVVRTIDNLERQLAQFRAQGKVATTPPPGQLSGSREHTPTSTGPNVHIRRQKSNQKMIGASCSMENITCPLSGSPVTPPSLVPTTPPNPHHLIAKHHRQRSSPDSLIYKSPTEETPGAQTVVAGNNQWSQSIGDLAGQGRPNVGTGAERGGGAPNEAFEYDDDDGIPLLGPNKITSRPLPPVPPSDDISSNRSHFEHQDSTESEVGNMLTLGPGQMLYDENAVPPAPMLKSWKLLRQPIEVAMFLHYLLENQKNVVPLLFFVIIEQYKSGTSKDLVRWAYEITSTFLAPDSPLCIDDSLEGAILQDIDSYMKLVDDNQQITDIELVRLFSRPKLVAINKLEPLLEEFQRELERKTTYHPDFNSDSTDGLRLWENTLINLLRHTYPLNEPYDSMPNVQSAQLSAIATVLRLTVVKSEQCVKMLEHIPTFVSKEKSRLKLFPQRSKKSFTQNTMGHSFQGTHYTRVTHCTVCQDILWGVGEQGLQCVNCEMNIHKHCIKNIEENCVGQETARKKANRRSASNMFRAHDNDSATELDKLCASSGSNSTTAKPVVRSESFRQRRENRHSYRKRSDPNIPRSKSDVDAEDKPKMEKSMYRSDSDLDCDDEPPKWLDNIDFETQRLVKPKEKKRQDVLNELFHTERSHVRNLKILNKVFYEPLKNYLDSEYLERLFPNLPQLIQVHSELNEKMKAQRKTEPLIGNIGPMMLEYFTGEGGALLVEAIANFTKNQRFALEELKVKQKKDPKLQHFLAECSMKPECRKLHLKDIIASALQRLTKYPLLLENILKYTQPGSEYDQLTLAWEGSKKILAQVNKIVGDVANRFRVLDVQKHLEVWPPKEKEQCDDRYKDDGKGAGGEKKKKEAKNSIHPLFSEPNLSKHTLLHEGQLEWKLNKQKSITITAMLFDDFLVLLHKQDDKYHLRYHHVSLNEEKGLSCPPIIDIPRTDIKSALTIRDVATNKKGFFLVSLKQHYMYEFVAPSQKEKSQWLSMLESMDSLRDEAQTQKSQSSLASADPSATAANSTGGIASPEAKPDDPKPVIRRPEEDRVYQILEEEPLMDFSSAVTVDPPLTQTLPLAQPVASLPAQLKKIDEQIHQLLNEKYMIVAKMMGLPDEITLRQMADLSDNLETKTGSRDPLELLVSVLECTRQLQDLLSDSLKPSSTASVSCNCDCKSPRSSGDLCRIPSSVGSSSTCAMHLSSSPQAFKSPAKPTIPADAALKISHRLNSSVMALSQAVDFFDRKPMSGFDSTTSTLRLDDNSKFCRQVSSPASITPNKEKLKQQDSVFMDSPPPVSNPSLGSHSPSNTTTTSRSSSAMMDGANVIAEEVLYANLPVHELHTDIDANGNANDSVDVSSSLIDLSSPVQIKTSSQQPPQAQL